MSVNGHAEGADKQGRKSRVADQQTEGEDEQAAVVVGRSEAGQESGIQRARAGRVVQSRKTGKRWEGGSAQAGRQAGRSEYE